MHGARAAAVVGIVLAARVASAGHGAALVKYLDAETTTVLVADVAHARGTAMFAKAKEVAHRKLGKLAQDAWIDTIVVGAVGSPGDKRHLVIVVEGRVDKLVAKLPRVESQPRAGVAIWTVGEWDVAVLDRRLVVAPAGELAAVIDRVRGKPKATGPAAVRAVIDAAPTGADVFGGIVLTGGLAPVLGGEPRSAAFALAGASRLTVDLRLELADAPTAELVAQRLTGGIGAIHDQLEQLVGKELADSILVDQDGAAVRVTATLTADEVDRAIALIDAM